MISICSLITFLAFASVQCVNLKYPRFEDVYDEGTEKPHEKKETWVVLVAGSNGWYNYRHQSDVCHAYHVVRSHGIPEKNIITMMYDDIAHNVNNPYPGKIFHMPNGTDVYKGVKVDYSGDDVTPENFLAVLSGNKRAIKGGNGKVVSSTRNDHIFVYFTDHGGFGSVSFPNSMLTVKDLNNALEGMHRMKKFGRLVFYMEACESGSMFAKVLSKHINVYAVTASNAHESSWGCYCENTMELPCLGDCFSINWILDSEKEDLNNETLASQFQIVKKETNTSHVMHYGDLKIGRDYVAYYLGDKKVDAKNAGYNSEEIESEAIIAWPSREIHLRMLEKEVREAKTERERNRFQHKIEKLTMKREYFETFMKSLLWTIASNQSHLQHSSLIDSTPSAIESLNCFDDVIKAFHQLCFNLGHNPYALKYTYVFANLCDAGIDSATTIRAMFNACDNIEIQGIF
ncbi:unnamed protein product [Litomosoides sigmodontis]|uniref:legumain n=1 Tax=Litomosoides sigmodontis TaxID=42156 RepID=A0A3P6S8D0_LITSI|nr:unnamed protein product [Litomosoides sigmodontis]